MVPRNQHIHGQGISSGVILLKSPKIGLLSRNPFMVDQCRIIQLPRFQDPRGSLTFVESNQQIPFEIRRVYYLYDVPGGSERGGHAHKELQQLIIAMSGSFDVMLDDGNEKKRLHLNRCYKGLYVCPMIWRELNNFSSGSVCMVLASNKYDEQDYYRDYAEFTRARSITE
jgi:dTDP-4-dehydrorhamnose 3,5-epimerase-like enzyme